MAEVLVMMEQFVSAADIDGSDIKCPRCGSTSYVLIGNSQIDRKEDWQNGALVHTELGKIHMFELEIIECLTCVTRSRIKTAEVMALELVNQQLLKRIAELTEEDPAGFKGLRKPS